MTPPGELMDLIRRFEGLRLKPYLCPAGVPTIGYGHTGPGINMGSPPINKALAEMWAEEDALKAMRAAVRASPTLVGDRMALAAVADFIFNLGSGRYRASTLRRKIDAGDWGDVPEQLDRWVWGGGKKLPGLVLRRRAESALVLRRPTPK